MARARPLLILLLLLGVLAAVGISAARRVVPDRSGLTIDDIAPGEQWPEVKARFKVEPYPVQAQEDETSIFMLTHSSGKQGARVVVRDQTIETIVGYSASLGGRKFKRRELARRARSVLGPPDRVEGRTLFYDLPKGSLRIEVDPGLDVFGPDRISGIIWDQ
ncbi:MAG: hypothetical protein AB7S38_09605 [Vulcanimicrobiota bacterium]